LPKLGKDLFYKAISTFLTVFFTRAKNLAHAYNYLINN